MLRDLTVRVELVVQLLVISTTRFFFLVKTLLHLIYRWWVLICQRQWLQILHMCIKKSVYLQWLYVNILVGLQRNCWWPSLRATSSSESARAGPATHSHIGTWLENGILFTVFPLIKSLPFPSPAIRAQDRCRHFMIDMMEDGCYIIVGEKKRHRFLTDLVDFHCHTPIVPYSEVLTVACGKVPQLSHANICNWIVVTIYLFFPLTLKGWQDQLCRTSVSSKTSEERRKCATPQLSASQYRWSGPPWWSPTSPLVSTPHLQELWCPGAIQPGPTCH